MGEISKAGGAGHRQGRSHFDSWPRRPAFILTTYPSFSPACPPAHSQDPTCICPALAANAALHWTTLCFENLVRPALSLPPSLYG